MSLQCLWEKRSGRFNMDYCVTRVVVNCCVGLALLVVAVSAGPKGVDLSPEFQSKWSVKK